MKKIPFSILSTALNRSNNRDYSLYAHLFLSYHGISVPCIIFTIRLDWQPSVPGRNNTFSDKLTQSHTWLLYGIAFPSRHNLNQGADTGLGWPDPILEEKKNMIRFRPSRQTWLISNPRVLILDLGVQTQNQIRIQPLFLNWIQSCFYLRFRFSAIQSCTLKKINIVSFVFAFICYCTLSLFTFSYEIRSFS